GKDRCELLESHTGRRLRSGRREDRRAELSRPLRAVEHQQEFHAARRRQQRLRSRSAAHFAGGPAVRQRQPLPAGLRPARTELFHQRAGKVLGCTWDVRADLSRHADRIAFEPMPREPLPRHDVVRYWGWGILVVGLTLAALIYVFATQDR